MWGVAANPQAAREDARVSHLGRAWVIAVFQFFMIRAVLGQGVARKQIACQLGLDPRTVRKWARRAVTKASVA